MIIGLYNPSLLWAGIMGSSSHQDYKNKIDGKSTDINNMLDDYSNLLGKHSDLKFNNKNNPNNIKYVIKGKDFIEYDIPKQKSIDAKNQIEVICFFWYGSPWSLKTCKNLKEWSYNQLYPVKFTLSPASFGSPYQILSTRIFFAFKKMNLPIEINFMFASAIQKGYVDMTKMNSILTWISSHNIDTKKFMNTINGYYDKSMTSALHYVMDNYKIISTPSIVINGKYLIRVSKNTPPQEVLEISKFMIKHINQDDMQNNIK